jgi:sulfotransferase
LKFHFISGLPRSGSTLLSALLLQNPRFQATTTSPLYALADTLVELMGAEHSHVSFFDEAKRARVLKAAMEAYFSENSDVVFDTNRLWTSRAALLDRLYPDSRIIACVRDINSVIDSFEAMFDKDPLQNPSMFNFRHLASVYARVPVMMHAETGVIGAPHAALRQLWFSPLAKNLIVIRYESLARRPREVMEKLYELLGEPRFAHDFENVAYSDEAYDKRIGLPGLHTVRNKVEFRERPNCLPPDVMRPYVNSNFWDRAGENPRGVVVL